MANPLNYEYLSETLFKRKCGYENNKHFQTSYEKRFYKIKKYRPFLYRFSSHEYGLYAHIIVLDSMFKGIRLQLQGKHEKQRIVILI